MKCTVMKPNTVMMMQSPWRWVASVRTWPCCTQCRTAGRSGVWHHSMMNSSSHVRIRLTLKSTAMQRSIDASKYRLSLPPATLPLVVSTPVFTSLTSATEARAPNNSLRSYTAFTGIFRLICQQTAVPTFSLTCVI